MKAGKSLRKRPSWCAKPRPCDHDAGSAYCPHRECRQALEQRLAELEAQQRDQGQRQLH